MPSCYFDDENDARDCQVNETIVVAMHFVPLLAFV